MAQVIEIANPAEFNSVFEQVSSEQDFVICYITGGVDPATGKSWCGDCVTHKQAIEDKIIAKASGKVLLCLVPTRAEWSGKSDHPYKTHPILKVKGVPTVLLLREGIVVARAETDADFENDDLLHMIS